MPDSNPDLRKVSLTDKYDSSENEIFATGTQILVRMCIEQARLDQQAGLNTAGYITGYRGSPLGAVDAEFGRAQKLLSESNVIYEPGLNEDLAATALWGAQQAELRDDGKYDGVFGLWYGKGPGVDRSGDALRHANLGGSSAAGGVIAVFGDDHTCESSTTSHQSEYAFVDAMIPVLNPANIQELFDFGLHGWAMSRFTGTWVGLKCVKDNVESTASVKVGPERIAINYPTVTTNPVDGLNIRRTDTPQEQEARLHRHKIPAVLAYAYANGFNKEVLLKSSHSQIGIVTTGKSYSDTIQALNDLDITTEDAERLGLCLLKIGMPWPLEPKAIHQFAEGLKQIIVIEEKRGLIEEQLRSILFNAIKRPNVVGKKDEEEHVLFPSHGALDPTMIAGVIAHRLANLSTENESALAQARTTLAEKTKPRLAISDARRTPYFCAGCPHSTSTKLPEDARGYAGIGCHYMAQFMNRGVEGYTHMGGEGANWLGESHFSTRKHMFQNIGDGTYNHSGIMSIRASVSAGTNITYKILNNDAVALTGGQALEGGLDSNKIISEVLAAGAKKAVLVSDNPHTHTGSKAPPKGVEVVHRDNLISVQKNLAKIEGVTALVYEQTCAAEKRRRRKRGDFPNPAKRVLINSEVCEGCGDCSVQSNCVAILPKETVDGRKRQIDQSACNKDYSCLKGFCPSFVTIEGGGLKRPAPQSLEVPTLPEPSSTISLDSPFSAIITGIGGTGVVTIGAIIGMAAHLEKKGCGIIDMAGLAQKGGAVTSHIKLAQNPDDIAAIRVSAGEANLVLACDTLLLADPAVNKVLGKNKTHVVANTHETMTGTFVHDGNFRLPTPGIFSSLRSLIGQERTLPVDATRIATQLFGDAIAANMFLLGYAFQSGLIPLSDYAILRAIELNGAAVKMNQAAFNWGRYWFADLESAKRTAKFEQTEKSEKFDDAVTRRQNLLTEFQNANYAKRYLNLVDTIKQAEIRVNGKVGLLSEAVSLTAYRLFAYKDEYEVARLLSAPAFETQINQTFEGNFKIKYHLAPPLLTKIDNNTGRPRKKAFGAWLLPVFRTLAKAKVLRGTPLDVFGYTEERRRERKLVEQFVSQMTQVEKALNTVNYLAAVALAELPQQIRGYGPVKMAAIADYDAALPAVMNAFEHAEITQDYAA